MEHAVAGHQFQALRPARRGEGRVVQVAAVLLRDRAGHLCIPVAADPHGVGDAGWRDWSDSEKAIWRLKYEAEMVLTHRLRTEPDMVDQVSRDSGLKAMLRTAYTEANGDPVKTVAEFVKDCGEDWEATQVVLFGYQHLTAAS